MHTRRYIGWVMMLSFQVYLTYMIERRPCPPETYNSSLHHRPSWTGTNAKTPEWLHQNQVLMHMQSRSEGIICSPNLSRPHKQHNLCSLLDEPSAVPCDVVCPSLEILQSKCGVTIQQSMENDDTCTVGNDQLVCASVHADADVHMQYYSWSDVDFFAPAPTQQALGFLASFVSNCVPWRVDYLSALSNALPNHTVHHYGQCLHNADSTELGGKYHVKDSLARRHLYTFAFENSETRGYVTEKLFNTLSAGAVPVYRGAPDILQYLPARNAAVVVDPHMDPTDLATLLVSESKDMRASRLRWKQGPDLAWVVQMDMGIVHSHCRICMRIMDMERTPSLSEDMIWIRERGHSRYTPFPLVHPDFISLCLNISAHFTLIADAQKPHGAGAVAKLYRTWDRQQCPITTMEGLEPGMELEAVMENPGWLRRGSVPTPRVQ